MPRPRLTLVGSVLPPPELDVLLSRIAGGDRAAFCTVFQLYAPRIRGYLTRLTRDATLSEELTQDVLLQVWRVATRFDASRGSAEAWVFAIARNRALDHLRRQRLAPPDPTDPCWVPDAPLATDTAVDEQQRSARVWEAVDQLPEPQREVLQQAFYEARSYPEIATEQGVALGTVKSRARLAFERLRSALSVEDL